MRTTRWPGRGGSATSALIRSDCDASLRRLGVERIDLFQLHFPPEDGTPLTREAWERCSSSSRAGKVAAVGASNFDVRQLERCARALGGLSVAAARVLGADEAAPLPPT